MTSDCKAMRALHERELDGRLGAREFAALDRHREACPGCAAHMRGDDPLALFRALADDRRDDAFWAGFQDAVRGGMREEGRLGPAESFWLLRPGYRLGLAGALALAVAAVGLVLGTRLDVPPPPSAPLAGVVGDAADRSMQPTVESIQSPDAQVYEMKVFGEGDQVTQLVMIFDEGIDL